MIKDQKVIVIDIDGTLCDIKKKDQEYLEVSPKPDVIKKLKEYKKNGFYIILFTSRNMKTYNCNIGKINANTSKILFEWLEKYDIEYDEIYFGKPWCGNNGFYIDDKAIRPKEFLELDYDEIIDLISKEA